MKFNSLDAFVPLMGIPGQDAHEFGLRIFRRRASPVAMVLRAGDAPVPVRGRRSAIPPAARSDRHRGWPVDVDV